MSQAHYVVCDGQEWRGHDPQITQAIARITTSEGLPWSYCRACLDDVLDFADTMGAHSDRYEPTRIEWLWDAGTRVCLVHRWPAVLCDDADWTHRYEDTSRGLRYPRPRET